MKISNRSILKELENALAKSNETSEQSFESRADHVLTSIINLSKAIESNYVDDQVEYLLRRMMLAIKNKDVDTFSKSLKKVHKQSNTVHKQVDNLVNLLNQSDPT